MLGRVTAVAEVTHMSEHGCWLLLAAEELFLPFAAFPWFRQATIEEILEVQWPAADHLYWPLLDIDLSVQSIWTPEGFPLMADGLVGGG